MAAAVVSEVLGRLMSSTRRSTAIRPPSTVGPFITPAAQPVAMSSSGFGTNPTFKGNSAGGNGGAIFADGDVAITGVVVFTQNDAVAGEGGAIYAENISDAPGNESMFPQTFTSNSALGNGGAIRARGSVNLLNHPGFGSNVAGNGTTADGGAIYADGSVVLGPGTANLNLARNGGAVYGNGSITLDPHSTLSEHAG